MGNLQRGGWQFPPHGIEDFLGIEMCSSFRQYLNLADSQKPRLVCFRNVAVIYYASIYQDMDPDKHEWILVFCRGKEILFAQTVNEEYGLGHLMHLADMAFESKEWLEKLQDPTYVDEYQLTQLTEDDLPIEDAPEPPPLTFGQVLDDFIKKPQGPEISKKEFDATCIGIPQPEPEPDPLDYKFGESACDVFERWSKELKKMREKLKSI